MCIYAKVKKRNSIMETRNIKSWHLKRTGRILNLDAPDNFGNKIQWLKIFDVSEEKTKFADIIFARDFIKNHLGEEFVPEEYTKWEKIEDIDYDHLPETFNITASHGTETAKKIIRKSNTKAAQLSAIVSDWLNTNFALKKKQYELEDICPKILVDQHHGIKRKLEFWCFSGVIEFVTIDNGKGDTCTYDLEWNKLDFTPYGRKHVKEIIKPNGFDELSEALQKAVPTFPFVRIDFALSNGKAIFDRFTFAPNGGLFHWAPTSYNKIIGDKIQLPEGHKLNRNKEIVIESIDVSGDEGDVVLTYKVNINGQELDIWYRISNLDMPDKISKNIDPIVVGLLEYAMALGYNFRSNFPITRDLYYQLRCLVIRALRATNPVNSYGVTVFAPKVPHDSKCDGYIKETEAIVGKCSLEYIAHPGENQQSTVFEVTTNLNELINTLKYANGLERSDCFIRCGQAFIFSNIACDYRLLDEGASTLKLQIPQEKFVSDLWFMRHISTGNYCIRGLSDTEDYLHPHVACSFNPEKPAQRFFRIRQSLTRKAWKKDFFHYLDSVTRKDRWAWQKYLNFFNETVEKVFEDNMPGPLRRKLLYRKFRIEALLYGVGANDYFYKLMYKKSILFANRIVSQYKIYWLDYYTNRFSDMPLIGDKRLFANNMKPFFGRKWCDESFSKEEFIQVFQNVKKIIVKPSNKFGGKGIETFELDNDSLGDTFDIIKERFVGDFVAEEFMVQSGLLHDFNETSLNTIRVVTIRNPQTKEVFVADAYLRVGKPGEFIDNFSSGGVTYTINTSNGMIGKGMCKSSNGKEISEHPGTSKCFVGMTIPRWEEVLEKCRSAHSCIKEDLAIVGWDVCNSDENIFLIEANSSPGFGRLYDDSINQWKPIKNMLDSLSDNKQ